MQRSKFLTRSLLKKEKNVLLIPWMELFSHELPVLWDWCQECHIDDLVGGQRQIFQMLFSVYECPTFIYNKLEYTN